MPSLTGPAESAEQLQKQIMRLVGGRRLPPDQIIKEVGGHLKIRKNRVKRAIRDLVSAGELSYTSEYGRTFLEASFDRPVRVAERIVLTPPGKGFQPGPSDVVICIVPGASFGAGRHPTTRLALRGIEFVLAYCGKPPGGTGSRVLDIGAGSGVLAIAAVMLGCESAVGVDVDPCAVAEAKANVRLNGLEGRIVISDELAESVEGPFALIAANLRLPTLLRLASTVALGTLPGGAVVVSGVRVDEREALLSAYARQSFEEVWCGAEDDWMGLALRKTGS